MPRLHAAKGLAEAVQLANERVPVGGIRKHHSNLGFFLHYFQMPDGASSEERAAYKRLFARMVEEGSVDLTKGDPSQHW